MGISTEQARTESALRGFHDLRPRFFCVKFRIKSFVWDVHVHFDCAGLRKNGSSVLVPRHFPRKFSHEIARDCSCDMPMCISTPQAGSKRGPVLGPWLFQAYFRIKLVVWDVHVHFDCAGSRKTGGGPFLGIFPVNSHINLLLWHVHFDCAGSHKTVVPVLVCDALLVNSRTNRPFCEVHVHFGCPGLRKTVVPVLVLA